MKSPWWLLLIYFMKLVFLATQMKWPWKMLRSVVEHLEPRFLATNPFFFKYVLIFACPHVNSRHQLSTSNWIFWSRFDDNTIVSVREGVLVSCFFPLIHGTCDYFIYRHPTSNEWVKSEGWNNYLIPKWNSMKVCQSFRKHNMKHIFGFFLVSI